MIINSECLAHMRTMDEFSVDFIITDCPYGLKFMGKKWDYELPSIDIWKETLRICKPGAMMAVFGGSRTHHRLMCSIEDAGWEVRDVIMWIYGSGFPKSHNFGKKIGGEWEGYGTALKPSYEPIILCMAPLDGTFAQNAEKWGVGGINVDPGRITRNSDDISGWSLSGSKESENRAMSGKNYTRDPKDDNAGRWPANSIFDEEAAEALDRMSGVLKSGSIEPHHKAKQKLNIYNNTWGPLTNVSSPGSSGGASRFFYCAKASTSERNAGLEGMELKETSCQYGYKENRGRDGYMKPEPKSNNHPTVKPLSLMRYLINLLAPPNDPLLLDPFAGSGSTLVASKQLGIRAMGIEMNAEYCEIAEKRIAAAVLDADKMYLKTID